MMATKRKKGRWWANHPRVWKKPLEDALASGDPLRIGLAWAIIYHVGGKKHGYQARLVELCGIHKSTLSEELSGKKSVSLTTLQRISETTGDQLHILEAGCHPLGFKLPGGEFIHEPGDRSWESMYSSGWAADPTAPSIEQWRQKRPDLFPPDVT